MDPKAHIFDIIRKSPQSLLYIFLIHLISNPFSYKHIFHVFVCWKYHLSIREETESWENLFSVQIMILSWRNIEFERNLLLKCVRVGKILECGVWNFSFDEGGFWYNLHFCFKTAQILFKGNLKWIFALRDSKSIKFLIEIWRKTLKNLVKVL